MWWGRNRSTKHVRKMPDAEEPRGMSSAIVTVAVVPVIRIWRGQAARMAEWARGPRRAMRGLGPLARPTPAPLGVAGSCSSPETSWREPLSPSCSDKEASREHGFKRADGAVLAVRNQRRKLKRSVATDMGQEGPRAGAGVREGWAGVLSTGQWLYLRGAGALE